MKRTFFLALLLLASLQSFSRQVVYDDGNKFVITLPDTVGIELMPDTNFPIVYSSPDSLLRVYVVALDAGRIEKGEFDNDDLEKIWREDFVANLDRYCFDNLGEPTDSTFHTWLKIYNKQYQVNDSTVLLTRSRFDEHHSYLVAVRIPSARIDEAREIIDSFESPYVSYTWKFVLLYLGICALLYLLGVFFDGNGFALIASITGIAGLILGIIFIIADPIYIWYSIKHLFI